MEFVIEKNDTAPKQTTGFGMTAKLLHWGMAVLILVLLCAIEFRDIFPKGPIRHAVTSSHFQLGLCVLFLFFVRVVWRIKNPVPPILPALSGMQKLASTAGHYLLYALMFLLPFLGILTRQSRGDGVDFFGYDLPVLLDEEMGLPYAKTIKAAHVYLGNIMIGLIVAHIVMAIFHHYIRRDNTLRRMLPDSFTK